MAGVTLRYRSVHSRLWNHPDFRGCDADTQRLWLWLLLGPNTNSVPGLATNARAGTISDGLRIPARKVTRMLKHLKEVGLHIDDQTGTMWFVRGAQDVPFTSITRNNVRGWCKVLVEVPASCPFKQAIIDYLSERLGDAKAADGTPHVQILRGSEPGEGRREPGEGRREPGEGRREPGEGPSSKSSSKSSSESSCTDKTATHREEGGTAQPKAGSVRRILQLEDELRADLGLPAISGPHRETSLLSLLREGHCTADGAEQALRVLHSEVRADPSKAWLFDGHTTWSPKVLLKAAGRNLVPPGKKSTGRSEPPPSEIVWGGEQQASTHKGAQ